MEIHVVAKQWMWKLQHPERNPRDQHAARSRRRAGQACDDFPGRDPFLRRPDFRIKQRHPARPLCRDLVSGDGDRHIPPLLHPVLRDGALGDDGSIVVMSKPDFAAWLVEPAGGRGPCGAGRALFVSLGCAGCHTPGGPIHAPDLHGLFGHRVPLASGRFALVDDAWIRDCILSRRPILPPATPPIMPSFKDEVDDGQILALTAYIRSLSAPKPEPPDDRRHCVLQWRRAPIAGSATSGKLSQIARRERERMALDDGPQADRDSLRAHGHRPFSSSAGPRPQ